MARNLLAVLSILIAGLVEGQTANRVAEIILTGPTYAGDQWTLQFSNPIAATASYTTTAQDTVGSNVLTFSLANDFRVDSRARRPHCRLVADFYLSG